MKPWRIAAAVVLAAILSGLGYVIADWPQIEAGWAGSIYGQTPTLNFADREKECATVWAFDPPARVTWYGKHWQDEHLLWEDLHIRTPFSDDFDPGLRGPLEVGQEVCGLGRLFIITHTPTERLVRSITNASWKPDSQR